jgi:hypothetical protein
MSVQVAPTEHPGLGGVSAEIDWLTCLDDQLDHAVAISSDAGTVDDGAVVEQYALCGTLFVTAPPACVPRPPCPRCARLVRACDSLRGTPEGLPTLQTAQHARHAWLRRLQICRLASVELLTSGRER